MCLSSSPPYHLQMSFLSVNGLIGIVLIHPSTVETIQRSCMYKSYKPHRVCVCGGGGGGVMTGPVEQALVLMPWLSFAFDLTGGGGVCFVRDAEALILW